MPGKFKKGKHLEYFNTKWMGSNLEKMNSFYTLSIFTMIFNYCYENLENLKQVHKFTVSEHFYFCWKELSCFALDYAGRRKVTETRQLPPSVTAKTLFSQSLSCWLLNFCFRINFIPLDLGRDCRKILNRVMWEKSGAPSLDSLSEGIAEGPAQFIRAFSARVNEKIKSGRKDQDPLVFS